MKGTVIIPAVVGALILLASLANGVSFTLSDAALMSLDWNLQNAYWEPVRARILERRDIPGPGVEFDIFFAGNGESPGDKENDGLFYAVSSPNGGSGGLLGRDISAYNSFDLGFTLLSVNGQPTTNAGDYIAVGTMISKLNSTWGYKPYGLDLWSGSYPNQVLAQTKSNDTQIRLVGFTVYLLPFTGNQWNPSGTTMTLRVAPAPGADQLFPQRKEIRIEQLAQFADRWLQDDCIWPGQCGGSDRNGDGYVDLSDFAMLAKHWNQPPDLLGHWRLDGSFADSAGGYAGTPQGDPEFVGAPEAKVGTFAMELDGNDSVVTEGFTGIAGTAARTTMAWIKTTGTVGPIIYWGDKNTVGGLWDLRVGSTGCLRLAAGGGPAVNGTTAVNTGQWVHVAAVLPDVGVNTEDVRLYVNGVLETGATATAGALSTRSAAAMRIGANEAGANFSGLIDDVRVYDRALTAEEIGELAGL